MVVTEDGPVRCSECGTVYQIRIFAVGLCMRCGSRRLNINVIEPANMPPPVRQFEAVAC